jgi:hypothetical protein
MQRGLWPLWGCVGGEATYLIFAEAQLHTDDFFHCGAFVDEQS